MTSSINDGRALLFSTRSLLVGPSPAMLPKAQTACSTTLGWLPGASRRTRRGTEPAFTTVAVWSEVPDATLVKAHAASNWRAGLKQVLEQDLEEYLHRHSYVQQAWQSFRAPFNIVSYLASQAITYLLKFSRARTQYGTTPALIMSSIGGFCSLLRVFLAAWTAISWSCSSGLCIPEKTNNSQQGP